MKSGREPRSTFLCIGNCWALKRVSVFSLCIVSSDKLPHEKQDPFRWNYTLDIETFWQLHCFVGFFLFFFRFFFKGWQTSQSYWPHSISFQRHMRQFCEEKSLLQETHFSSQHTRSDSLKTNKQTNRKPTKANQGTITSLSENERQGKPWTPQRLHRSYCQRAATDSSKPLQVLR